MKKIVLKPKGEALGLFEAYRTEFATAQRAALEHARALGASSFYYMPGASLTALGLDPGANAPAGWRLVSGDRAVVASGRSREEKQRAAAIRAELAALPVHPDANIIATTLGLPHSMSYERDGSTGTMSLGGIRETWQPTWTSGAATILVHGPDIDALRQDYEGRGNAVTFHAGYPAVMARYQDLASIRDSGLFDLLCPEEADLIVAQERLEAKRRAEAADEQQVPGL
ncbi:hypothetical protein LAZ40_02265 [Cereibacter sphaeroides]|uniref:hypothetical protein n=1 Tax=Cereibacter sphaeroides TaxID=1063 RepID=UPI001F44FAB8|nr:hypothetical protein [Cereibacter sphaeroides]MCE6957882.1 hypothetical protein [Cereibacter sphaeroides]MCE6971851.1 hypothetical protein [Cereibacter sphaeroides]